MTNQNKFTQQEIKTLNLERREYYFFKLKLIEEQIRNKKESLGDLCGSYDVLVLNDRDMKALIKGKKQLRRFEKKIEHIVGESEYDTSNLLCLLGPEKDEINKYMDTYFKFEGKKMGYSEESLKELFFNNGLCQ